MDIFIYHTLMILTSLIRCALAFATEAFGFSQIFGISLIIDSPSWIFPSVDGISIPAF